MENTLTLEHNERLNKLQQKFVTQLENTKTRYEKTNSKTMTVKHNELALIKQRLVDQKGRDVLTMAR